MPVLALGIIVAALAGAGRWPPLDQAQLNAGIRVCVTEKDAARERLASQHSACTEDADCVAFSQVWLGCSGWRSIRAPFPEGVVARLDGACLGLPSFGLDCDGSVGACVEGRCAGRSARGTGCPEATAAILRRASQPPTCTSDAECTTLHLAKSDVAVTTRFEVESAKELHAHEDACAGEAPGAGVLDGSWRFPAACVEGTCRPVPAKPPRFRGARWSDARCLSDRLQTLLARTSARGKAMLRFIVGVDGRTGAFQFLGDVPEGLREPFIWAVLDCAHEPATWDGTPIRIWVAQPIRAR